MLYEVITNSSFTKNRAIQVEVPQTISGSSIGEIESHILLTLDHKIFINDKECTKSTFSVALLDSIGNIENPVIIIEGDRGISYDFLMEIIV